MPFTMLTHDGRLLSQDETPFMRASATRGAIAPTEITLVNRDGSRMPVLCSAAPVLGEAGTVESVVLVLQDLSNLKQIEQVRADFFSMVTHDLKTPVSTIKGIARAAQGESNDPSVATYFDAIDEEADHLTELISNFLDMSRIEAGAGILDPETCHIADLVDDAVRRARRGRPGAGRTIETDVYPGLPALYADPAQIGRVLDNLVSNGLKYSDGPLTVRAYADGGRVVTEVIDRGVGVPAEHMSDVFSKFFRVKRSDRRGREGAGLGLAICKAIVEAHRGEIGVRSKEREGSTFWFTLPEDTGKPA
jgi:signal transduction histidine kinase